MPNNPDSAAATGLPSSLNILDPASLPEEYGLHVKGDCMAPEIPDGSFVYASRSQPYKVGDLVVLWWRPEFILGGQQQAIIKRLVMAPPPYVKIPYRENPKSEVHALMMVEMLKPIKRCGSNARGCWRSTNALAPSLQNKRGA